MHKSLTLPLGFVLGGFRLDLVYYYAVLWEVIVLFVFTVVVPGRGRFGDIWAHIVLSEHGISIWGEFFTNKTRARFFYHRICCFDIL